jgi:hypothetical protein
MPLRLKKKLASVVAEFLRSALYNCLIPKITYVIPNARAFTCGRRDLARSLAVGYAILPKRITLVSYDFCTAPPVLARQPAPLIKEGHHVCQ